VWGRRLLGERIERSKAPIAYNRSNEAFQVGFVVEGKEISQLLLETALR
jgi:hypothetical protein